MSKGSSQPAGQTNVTNPAQVAQQPYLNYGYEQAKNQFQNTPYYPGSTVAPYYAPNPLQAQGYNELANAGQQSAQTLQPAANNVFNEAATRQYGGPANPAYGGYMGLAYGDSYVPQNFGNLQAQNQWGGQNYANQVAQYAPGMQQTGQQAYNTGNQYAGNVAGYSNPMQQTGQQAYGTAQGYANNLAGYSDPMQQTGQQAYGTAQDYAGNIAGYSDPMMQYAAQAAAGNNMGLNSLMSTAGGQGVGMEQLARSAGGEYVGQNPYLAGAMQAAIDPVTRNYQTAIAPGIDAAAAQSGRGRSGAVAGMANTAQQNLLRETGNITQEMSSANLARERQLQDAAAQQYAGQMTQAGQAGGQLYNAGLGLGMTGLQNAAGLQRDAASTALAGAQAQQQGLLNAAGQQQAAASTSLAGAQAQQQGLSNAAGQQQAAGALGLSAADRALSGLTGAASAQGAAGSQFFAGQNAAQAAANQYAQAQQTGLSGLSSGFNTQNQAAMDAMRYYPQLAAANQQGARAQIEAGQGLTAQDQQYRQYHQAKIAEDMARYNYPQQQLKDYMELIGNPLPGSTSTPYYRNQGAEVMSGITGALGIGKTLLGGGLGKI